MFKIRKKNLKLFRYKEPLINLELEFLYTVFNIPLIYIFPLYFAVYLKIGIRKIVNMYGGILKCSTKTF